MKSLVLKRIITNLVLIAVIVPLVWMGLVWVEARILLGPSNSPYAGASLLLNLLTLVPQMLLAGILQQLAIAAMPPSIPVKRVRFVATFAALVSVPLVIVAMTGDLGVLAAPDVALALILAIGAYALVMRLPIRMAISPTA